MGRPPTKPKKLRDGYYIEVRNRGARDLTAKTLFPMTHVDAAMSQAIIGPFE